MFDKLTLWDINIPQDPDGIPSYVRHVRFKSTPFPALEPGTLARILKTFTSIISLEFGHTRLPPPDELAVPLSLGEFGKGITRLILAYIPDSDPAEMTTSFISSFRSWPSNYVNRGDGNSDMGSNNSGAGLLHGMYKQTTGQGEVLGPRLYRRPPRSTKYELLPICLG